MLYLYIIVCTDWLIVALYHVGIILASCPGSLRGPGHEASIVRDGPDRPAEDEVKELMYSPACRGYVIPG